MPNFSQVLKAEIARISRKEVKSSVNPLRSAAFTLRITAASLKRRVASLEAETKRLIATQNALLKKANESALTQGAGEKLRITSRTIKALRKNLGVSQNSLAVLLGVSGHAVYLMEQKNRRLKLRAGTLSKLLALRGIGKREAARRLEEMKASVNKVKGKKVARKR